MLKLQEAPDSVPNGELPRHLQIYCDRYLTEKVVPGNRVTVIGIYSIKKGPSGPGGGGRVRMEYLKMTRTWITYFFVL